MFCRFYEAGKAPPIPVYLILRLFDFYQNQELMLHRLLEATIREYLK